MDRDSRTEAQGTSDTQRPEAGEPPDKQRSAAHEAREVVGEVRRDAQGAVDGLQEGDKVNVFGEAVPSRLLIAIGIFVAVFTLVLLGTWLLLEGWGMVVGIIAGAVAGALAARRYATEVTERGGGSAAPGASSPPTDAR